MSSTLTAELLPCACVLVSDIDAFESFFRALFGEQSTIESLRRPVRHSVVSLVTDAESQILQKITIVHKASCDVGSLSVFKSVSVSQIFMAVKNPALYQMRATSLIGANVVESNVDDQGIGTRCVIEGPEGISIHFMSNESQSVDIYSLLMTMILAQPDKEDDGSLVLDGPSRSMLTSFSSSSTLSSSPTSSSPSSSSSSATLLSSSPSSSPAPQYYPKIAPTVDKKIPIPVIPTLEASILSNQSKSHVPMLPNSREMIPFETEFFKGHALLAIRLVPPDPVYDCFFKGKKTFEVQVQGKFKRQPIGELYCGAEAVDKMELGLITRSISKAVCNFATTIINDLHYSFGDSPTNANYQVPHIVAPLFPTLDKVVVTPPSQEPPPMGAPFVEDLEYRARRLKFKSLAEAQVDINNTYSFSVNTANLDLTTWDIVGIPMMKSMDMRTFFGESPIRLVAYEIPKSVADSLPNIHPMRSLNYAFNIKLNGLDADKVVDITLDHTDDEHDEAGRDSLVVGPPDSNITSTCGSDDPRKLLESEADGDDDDDDDGDNEVDEDDQVGGDATTPNYLQRSSIFRRKKRMNDTFSSSSLDPSNALSPMRRFLKLDNKEKEKNTGGNGAKSGGGVGGGVSNWFRRRFDDLTPDATDIPETTEWGTVDYEMESTGDLRYCPACFELNDIRRGKEKQRRFLYVLPFAESANSQEGESILLTPRFRSYTEISKAIPMLPIAKLHKNKKLSITEKKRRQIIESYKALLLNGTPKAATVIHNFLNKTNEVDNNFLGGVNTVVMHKKKPNSVESFEGNVAIAITARHWSEQYLVVTKSEIVITKSADMAPSSRRASIRIPLGSVTYVRPLRHEETPMQGVSFFQVETFARIHYFAVRTERHLNEWLQAFSSFLGPATTQMSSARRQIAQALPSFVEPEEAYLAKPMACFKLDKKRIFNYRHIIFNPVGLPRRLRDMHPCELAESILIKAFDLLQSESGNATAVQWITFMDELSVLQTVDITVLSERERCAFFLNLYHIMVAHGTLVIGPPPSWSSWQSFFNTVSYMLSYDIISIAELEHNILRASMSRPSPLFSKITVPHSQFPGFALSQGDFRLNFCINNGSRSMPKFVPIYRTETLDRQLDDMVCTMLAGTVEIDSNRRTVILPKVCQWFLPDFAASRSSSNQNYGVVGAPGVTVVPVDALRVIAHYLKGEDKHMLMRMLSDGINPIVKFRSFNFQCRPITRLEETN